MQPETEAPPLIAPPHQAESPRPKRGLVALLLVIGALLLKFGKVLLVSLKFLKLGAILQTGGTMLLTAWLYSVALGWPFAVGFVVTILVHELGHVLAAMAYRVPVSAPMFIPFMGALIMKKTPAPSVFAEAVIAIAGPVAGALAGVVCWIVYAATGSPLFLGLAHVTFLMNLFNLIPVFPMDGGRVLGAVSKWFLIVGMVVLTGMFLTGLVRNPLLLILIVMALPRVFTSFKGGSLTGAPIPTSVQEKVIVSVAYVVLAGSLAWAMALTDTHVSGRRLGHQMAQSPRAALGTKAG